MTGDNIKRIRIEQKLTQKNWGNYVELTKRICANMKMEG